MPLSRSQVFDRARHDIQSLSKMGQRGGIRSGEVRRAKAVARKADEAEAEAPVELPELKPQMLFDLGVPPGDPNDTVRRRWKKRRE